MDDEGFCSCTSCGEEISISIDMSAGPSQEFIHDGPKCSHSNRIHVEVEEEGDVRVWVTSE